MRDEKLLTVVAELKALDSDGCRTSMVLRQTMDQLYDGQHTGRYRWDQLHKTEKTHCGTLVEINLHREFDFGDGERMDYRIAGIDVDCKYSQSIGGWMIPTEAMDHLCMLVWANDERGVWSLGVVRISEDILTKSGNRDSKRSISAKGRERILWLFEEAELPPNVLLQLPRETVNRIMTLRSGQRRIDEIFRVAQKKRIGRGVISTLGQQEDYMKRVRGNGGSRSRLAREGIIILGHYDGHSYIAKELEVPVPMRGEFVAVRVAPAERLGRGTVSLGGRVWRIADENDPIVHAPDCPHTMPC